MHGQDSLLINILDRHKASVRPTDRLADRLGVVPVVLIVLPIGATNCGAISRTSWPNDVGVFPQ